MTRHMCFNNRAHARLLYRARSSRGEDYAWIIMHCVARARCEKDASIREILSISRYTQGGGKEFAMFLFQVSLDFLTDSKQLIETI